MFHQPAKQPEETRYLKVTERIINNFKLEKTLTTGLASFMRKMKRGFHFPQHDIHVRFALNTNLKHKQEYQRNIKWDLLAILMQNIL